MKRKNKMVAPVYTLILTPNGSKKAWPPQITPQNDGYVFCQLKNKNLFPQTAIFQVLKNIYIINIHVFNTTNKFKYKERRIRRRRIVRKE